MRLKDRTVESVIVVNRRDCGERQRFTVAHELGHMVLNIAPTVEDEEAAHRFAGAFLIPDGTLRAKIGKRRQSIGWSELFHLKRIFGVSVQALTFRCNDLRIFSNSLSQHLFNEFNRRGWRRPPYREPLAMNSEAPKRFERLCFRALAEGAISESKAAELLGRPVHDVVRLMDEPPSIEAASVSP